MDFKGWIAKAGSIELQDVIDDLGADPKRGAITTFTGVTRTDSDKTAKNVVSIEVESWEGKGSEAMQLIAEEIGNKHDLLGIRIIHLEGNIEIGEPIVYVVISSAHRQEAFAALEDSIHAYKQRSPVWKKEIYEDGSGDWIKTAK